MPTTPADRDGCMCRLLPRSRGLPRYAGGSASASLLSRPAQALLTLRPAGLLNRPRRPLSRGFGPAGYPAKPLVSYQSNRQLSGWNPPPLVVRAIGAHCKILDLCTIRGTGLLDATSKRLFSVVARCNCGTVAKNDCLILPIRLAGCRAYASPAWFGQRLQNQSPDNPVGSMGVASVCQCWRS